MELNYLPIKKSKTKMDKFIISLDDKEYLFEFYWNDIGKFFSFNMYDSESNPIILGRKITYNINMLDNIIDERLPNVAILPLDPSLIDGHITYDNFMESVKCYILPGDA